VFRPTRRSAFAALAVAGTCLAATIPGLALGDKARSSAVEVTFWSWVPHLQDQVNQFNKTHSDIHVKLVNVGNGLTEYQKLRTALKAGSGAPDVVQIEFQYIPTFTTTKSLVDISQYGAAAIAKDYVPWTWSQVSSGGKVWAIPQDSGPLGMLYRADIFSKYGIKVPRTWAEYAAAAAKLHKADSKAYLTNFASNEGGWLNGLFWQSGSEPFSVEGTTVKIKIDDAPALKVASYWEKLVKSGVISPAPNWNNAWYAGLTNGTYATWVTAGWGPTVLSGFAAKSSGKWRAAPLPQWGPGKHVSANWGGSTDAVTVQSDHPKEAAEFAIWLNHARAPVHALATDLYLFPVLKAELDSPVFKNASVAFYGGQKVNRVFSAESKTVDVGFQWSPFQDYVYSTLQEQFGKAVQGKQSFADALHQTQSIVVKYAKDQGFTVEE
jgi:multiple sugar transport system substrate-binding protein